MLLQKNAFAAKIFQMSNANVSKIHSVSNVDICYVRWLCDMLLIALPPNVGCSKSKDEYNRGDEDVIMQ